MSETCNTPNCKPWWKSRTLRVNALAAALIAVELQFQLLRPLLGEATYSALAITLAAVNGFLRVITRMPLSWQMPQYPPQLPPRDQHDTEDA